jgi:hypothetical protein
MPRRSFPLCSRCNKTLYPTNELAIRVALRASVLRGLPMRVYPCYSTGTGFHLTKKRKGGVRNV